MFQDKNKKTIGIIGAMQSEIDAIQEKIRKPKSVKVSGIEFVYGEMYEVNVVAAMSGVGKVFAAICAQTMILHFQPSLVINIGVGGSLTKELAIADVAIAEKVVQYDMDTTALGNPQGMIYGMDRIYFPCSGTFVEAFSACAQELGIHYRRGVIASGDCFVNDSAKKEALVRQFGAIVCEMEGASIGQVCFVNNTPFGVVRAISDNGDENSNHDFNNSLERASGVAIRLVDTLIKHHAGF